jgi:protein-export membrane protein SecD
MEGKDYIWFIVILAIAGWAIWIVQSPDHPIRQGLDLQGGLQVLLKADVPADQEIEKAQLDTSRQIIEQRVNALGVAEPLVQTEGDRRILVELPGIDNPDEAVALIQETALLEFVDTGTQPLTEGMCIRTNLNEGASRCEFGPDGNQILSSVPTYETVMTGAAIQSAESASSQLGQYFVEFTLRAEDRDLFANYTRENQGNFLTIVLDKQVISSPRISAVIEGQGTITGQFSLEEAQQLALKLRFGSLPIPLVIDSTRQIGATLGELSVASSVRAGAIGVAVVLLFMLVYYRLPGFLADLALILYAVVNLAVFMALPVTLTLPAITGFLISTGMAVDANILVFERMKEELRAGSSLRESILAGFDRAWTSIRDSNIATLVICFVLWTFGRSFGASAVQGFALTLAIGVIISMFTAVIVTRTFVRLTFAQIASRIDRSSWLLGV